MTNLKRIREEKGLSQSQLAEKAGIITRNIQAYEQGYRSINNVASITLYKLAQALECDMVDLLELEEHKIIITDDYIIG